jgi:arylsulfatase
LIPKTSATIAEVLHHYGYKTAAFGKWHNTPADQTTAMGPFDRWPTGHGFDYFYGFLAGETSQWEPRLVENTTAVEPPHDRNYHLSEDMAQRSIDWLRKHRAFSPDKPFFLYWAPGRPMGPTRWARSGLRSTRASSIPAGMPTASGCLPARSNSAGFPPTPN